jgi:peroxiredoxin
MKKIIIVVLVVFAAVQLQAQGFSINGELTNVKEGADAVVLDGMSNKELNKSKVNAGKFSLSGKVDNPTILVLTLEGITQKIVLFMGNDNVVMKGDANNIAAIQYSGSASQNTYQKYMTTLTPKIESYFKSMTALNAEKDAAKKDAINKTATEQTNDAVATFKGLLDANKNSVVSTFFLFQFANIFPAIKENIGTYFDLLGSEAKVGPFAGAIQQTIQSGSLGKIGSVLPDFTQNDVNGKGVSLNSFRGKYVLVDFWASWCGPCRGENPNVVKVYNAYKNKNFTVLGVSLDQDKNKWLEAIKKDNLTWTHVSDLKYWNNEVAVKFGIQSIPANFLIDPNGVVIARDVRGEDLERIVASKLK